jgi:hypothetical protein
VNLAAAATTGGSRIGTLRKESERVVELDVSSGRRERKRGEERRRERKEKREKKRGVVRTGRQMQVSGWNWRWW